MPLQSAAKRASRTPLQIAAMIVLLLVGATWLFGGEHFGMAFLIGLPLFAVLMFLGTRTKPSQS
ncbi:MAG: hypothetical protein DHS20C15_31490 [Planctomycetota bacterium]|nr:MAG: hypothetical protein DHS20C15_31490 [Planctomycetota bacterium]